MSKNKEEFSNKVFGALYGFAIGDAMGATTEFMDHQQIADQYGRLTEIVGGGWLRLKPGQVTDDTQMTLCVAQAIVDAKGTTEAFVKHTKKNFVKWYKSNPPDVGGQCAQGIQTIMYGKCVGKSLKQSSGNGSLMRALPCALVNNKDWNVLQGNLTHTSKWCNRCLKVYHDQIVDAIYGQGQMETITALELDKPTGYVINTFNNALYWSGNGHSFEDCILGAVNDGGDADTIAAISGSLSGARHGIQAMPTKWILGLDLEVRTALDNFAEYVMKYWETK